ncbi:MAG: hypothetical protein V4582_08930 [Pseudomonadota bacterium]
MQRHPDLQGLEFAVLTNGPFLQAQVYSFARHFHALRNQFDLLISNKIGAHDCENYFSKQKLIMNVGGLVNMYFIRQVYFHCGHQDIEKQIGVGKPLAIELKIVI